VTGSDAAPKRDDDDRALTLRWRQALPRHRSPSSRGRRAGLVLIVDDSRDARELYAMYLTHCGFSAFTARDGSEAVDAAVQLEPNVIVMDLSMPTVDGITATLRIRRHPRTRDIPLILLTGYPQQAIERDALRVGVDVFLTKPCLPEDLETHVRRLLETTRQP
jgi:CheY-like chemotaxis protein